MLHADEEDYGISFTNVSIAANETSRSFAVKIINDNITECNVMFKLMLSIPIPPCGVVSGSNNTIEVMVHDDDGKKKGSNLLCRSCRIAIHQQEQSCHLINPNILLKRTPLH